MLTYADVCERMLTYADVCRCAPCRWQGRGAGTGWATCSTSPPQSTPRSPPYPHVCSRMLTYASTKVRILATQWRRRCTPYAHVCSRMLTYAHVCSRMLSTQVRILATLYGGGAARLFRRRHSSPASNVCGLVSAACFSSGHSADDTLHQLQRYQVYLLYWYRSTNTGTLVKRVTCALTHAVSQAGAALSQVARFSW
jgi:hypothetical protein